MMESARKNRRSQWEFGRKLIEENGLAKEALNSHTALIFEHLGRNRGGNRGIHF